MLAFFRKLAYHDYDKRKGRIAEFQQLVKKGEVQQMDRIRESIRAAGLKQWEVAEACGITEYTLIRWLRRELSQEQREAVLQAIKTLKQARGV